MSADQAAARPIAGAHTIWELVLHIGAWEGVALRRLRGDFEPLPDDQNFPPVPQANATTWKNLLTQFEDRHGLLCRAISEFDDGRLDEAVNDTPTSYYMLLHGVIQHDLYHGGQIALLRKALDV